jgi:hypothetical protein
VQMGILPKTAAVYIEMYKAINAGVLAAQEPRSPENRTPTSFEKFVQDVFAVAYHGQATTAEAGDQVPPVAPVYRPEFREAALKIADAEI